MSMKTVAILGSTGSIGRQSLLVCRRLGYRVGALAANGSTPESISEIERQAREFRPALVALHDENAARDLKIRLADLPVRVAAGRDGCCEAAALPENDIVLNAVVGMNGLFPTLAALEQGKALALANKESLVAAGELVLRTAKEHGAKILPVDSEHSAVFQCLQGVREGQLAAVILTASGGPFFGRTREQLREVTREEALRHPNWSMGPKITVDSATLMNKALEIIEAAHLFGLPEQNIEVIVHRESVIHSLVELRDGSVLAQLGVPDMQVAIQYALTWPEREPTDVKKLSLADYGKLSFFPPDTEAFPCLEAGREALRRGGLYPCLINGANEEAVALFLGGKIRFHQIGELVEQSLHIHVSGDPADVTLDRVRAADALAREFILRKAGI